MSLLQEEAPKQESRKLLDDYEELKALQEQLGKAKNNVSLNMLASMIENVAELLEAHLEDKKDLYDSKLGETLTTALEKVSESLKTLIPQKLDLSPIAKSNEILNRSHETLNRTNQSISSLIQDISSQNKELIETIIKLEEKEGPDMRRYDDLLKQAMAMISRTNEFLTKSSVAIDYSKELKQISESLSRPVEWEFIVDREGGRIQKVRAKAK